MNKEKENQIIMYTTADGKTNLRVNVAPQENTVWLSQKQMSELFQTTTQNITMHIGNIYAEGELDENRTCKDFLQVQKEGNRNVERNTAFYNLDMIIALGYRIKSPRGTQFRIWATKVLNEYIRKGFAMNDELLKEAGGGNYFKELLERIRDIRASEKVFYRQVLDLFATSVDYNKNAEQTIEFFKEMQNKVLYGICGLTAAEIISSRANAQLPFMGLTNFRGNQPTRAEAQISKSYLATDELENLKYMVNSYLDIAEWKAKEQTPMYMKDWIKELDEFINYRKKPLLKTKGKVSHEQAIEIANEQYDIYKAETQAELTQAEKDYLEVIHDTYKMLSTAKPKKPQIEGKK